MASISKPLTLLILLMASMVFSQTKPTAIKGVTIKNSNEPDTTKVRINSTFLLLGTLNDYISHQYVTKQNQFDRYYDYEKPLMRYVDSIAQKDFNIKLVTEKGCFISDELANKMNAFYNGPNLIESLFTSDDKKLSFLLGAYYRNGEKVGDNLYKIQLANSPKHNTLYNFLKQLNCPDIYFKRLDNIPRIYILYFEATDIMQQYFATVAREKEVLLDAQLNAFRSDAAFKKEYREKKAKDYLKIQAVFQQDRPVNNE